MRRPALTSLTGLVLALVLAVPAHGSQSIDSFEVSMSTTEAGAHPDLSASFTLNSPGAPEAAKDVVLNQPEGIFGNPNAITQCTATDAAMFQCPSDSQAGLVTVRADYGSNPNTILGTAPLYNRIPEGSDETARLSFVVPTLNIPVSIPITVRTGSDYGLRFTISGLTQSAPLAGVELTVWGFPAAASHVAERFPPGQPGQPAGCPGLTNTSCNANLTPSTLSVTPLTINPSECTGQPLEATLDVQTYQDPGHLSRATAQYPPVTECARQVFRPVLRVRPTSTETDAPSGLDLELGTEQFLGLAATPSEIRSAVVTLPDGLTINPDAADGQRSCPDAAANFGSDGPANCPDNSKIGTFSMQTPALAGPLPGSIYFGEPKPGDTYRLIMVADGFGIHAKIVGSVQPDPETGRLTAYFTDLPQVPFDQFDVHLFSSQRGLMATPLRCTTYKVESEFTPWNGKLAPQRSPAFFNLESGPNGTPCPAERRPFSPRLGAGTSVATAGTFSDFSLKLDRDDGDQFLGDLNFRMPPGLTASLRGITYCPEAAVAAAAANEGRSEQVSPSCPKSSEIGTSNVAAGPGTHPFHAAGKMYLTGPFKGAPLSLAAITPALAGPYDYGVVVVRVAINVDPLTAQVKALSDTVPSIIGGVPIRMRSIKVSINRPDFMINPTNCAPFTVDSQGIGDQGTVADFSSYFQVVNCSTLPFKPQMKVTQLGKRKDAKRNRNPRMRFELFTRPGDANIKSLAVTLPKAFAIDQRHLGNICSKAQLASERCKGRQPIGFVETRTPLLDEPLKGPAYAVSGFGLLPQLAFILDGQVSLIPRAESSSVKVGGKPGFLQTVVPTVPDAPIGHFRLDLLGGSQGYLINTRDLCLSGATARVQYTSQSGKTLNQKVTPKLPCGSARKAKRAAKRASR